MVVWEAGTNNKRSHLTATASFTLEALVESRGQVIVSPPHVIIFLRAALDKYHVEAAINELTLSLKLDENGWAALMLFPYSV